MSQLASFLHVFWASDWKGFAGNPASGFWVGKILHETGGSVVGADTICEEQTLGVVTCMVFLQSRSSELRTVLGFFKKNLNHVTIK